MAEPIKVTLNQEIKNDTHTLLFNGLVQEITIQEYYDHHGDIILGEKKVYKNAEVKLEKHEYDLCFKYSDPMHINSREVTINGKKYEDGEITSIHGTSKLLQLKACTGAG